MAIVRSFCQVFTIRLGSFLVGCLVTLQASFGLAISLVWHNTPPRATQQAIDAINQWLKVSDGLHLLEWIHDDPVLTSKLLALLNCIYIASSLCLCYGAYKCKPSLLIPYIILDLLRFSLLTTLLIDVVIMIRENSQNLGLIIGATLAGSFFMMFILYCWVCVVSLWQALRQMKIDTPQLPPAPVNFLEELGFNHHPSFHSKYPMYGNMIAPVY